MSRLFWCLCSQCENADSSSIGLVCQLCNPQFTEDGVCNDFELKDESEE